jgi:hypothetical protein
MVVWSGPSEYPNTSDVIEKPEAAFTALLFARVNFQLFSITELSG